MKPHFRVSLGLALLALTAIQSLAQSVYTPYTFTTFAGLAGNSGSADGMGSVARFSYPQAVAVDSAGNVYVADLDNFTIRKMTPAGVVSTLAGLAGSAGSTDGTGSAARFYGPTGVAVDSAGNVYVADLDNQTIRKVTRTGMVSTLAGNPAITNQWGYPAGGYADGMGSVARFNYPSGVAVDSAGNVYVADYGNHTIRKVTAAGEVTTLAGLAGSSGRADGTGSVARFYYPSGVAVDCAANVYVADYGTIRKVTQAGEVTTLARGFGFFSEACYGPNGVAVDTAGSVYVADTCNHTIRKVTLAGEVMTLAGNSAFTDRYGLPAGGYADGTGSDARFNYPSGVAVDSGGNVYVADPANNTIRKGVPAHGAPPAIATQPAAQTTVEQNQPLNLNATASGTPQFYQWYKQEAGQVACASFPTYSIPHAALSDSGDYYVVVYNALGSVTSSVAHVTVNADTNPPTVVALHGSLDLYHIIVSFSEPVDTGFAEDPFRRR